MQPAATAIACDEAPTTAVGPEYGAETCLVRSGRDPARFSGMVNTPVFRGSTVLASSLEEWESRKAPGNPMASYGRFGTPTTRSLEEALAQLEGGHRSLVFPSGLAACAHALLACVRAGDHVLLTDSVYGPTRAFADTVLKRFGVEVEYFDPLIGGGIRSQLRRNTRAVFLESPGSWTFEMQDVPAIAMEAHRAGALVLMDSTWASPLFYRPFQHGVDVSIQSATKYIVGHSDALLGAATANARAWPVLQAGTHAFGQIAGPDDVYLALRGLRTLSVRLRQHWENGVRLAQSLLEQPLIERVLHPALPGDPGYPIWRRDYLGASGLFAIALRPVGRRALSGLFERLQLFGIGLSWGGFESLALPCEPQLVRAVHPVPYRGPIIRLHAGLESAQDLIDDMRAAFRYMHTLL